MKVQAQFVKTPQPSDDTEDIPQLSTSPSPLSGLRVLAKLHESRFPVFLVYSSYHEKNFALKIFPFKDEKPNASYQNEAQFRVLSHPNIVKMVKCVEKQKSSIGAEKFHSSCILMELATHGDFADLLVQHNLSVDKVLARTFFHQLIEGLEYLHTQNIGHMDLKLENLLLGDDLSLKIADFDLSCNANSTHKYIKGRGTSNYRAPEVKNKTCLLPEAADIYSCGIILFTLMSGEFPGTEDTIIQGFNLHDMMIAGNSAFWDAHSKVHRGGLVFDEDFKKMFFAMVHAAPQDRASIEELKKLKWYNGRVYSHDELKVRLSELGVVGKNGKIQC
jgi:serine/threonine protein kinase